MPEDTDDSLPCPDRFTMCRRKLAQQIGTYAANGQIRVIEYPGCREYIIPASVPAYETLDKKIGECATRAYRLSVMPFNEPLPAA